MQHSTYSQLHAVGYTISCEFVAYFATNQKSWVILRKLIGHVRIACMV